MATHSSTLAWGIPWTKEPGGLRFMGHKESDVTEQLHFTFSAVISHAFWGYTLCLRLINRLKVGIFKLNLVVRY